MRLATAGKVFLSLVWFVASTIVGAPQASTTTQERIETVSLCELTKSWNRYDHKVVRIEAIYRAGAETSEVYDTGCPNSDHTAWVPPDIEGATPTDLIDKLNRLLKSNGRARILVVGEFDGPKKVEIPPGTSPGLADTLRAANSHYGHQNGWDFQFVFSKIGKVDAVPASDPWPRWASEKKK